MCCAKRACGPFALVEYACSRTKAKSQHTEIVTNPPSLTNRFLVFLLATNGTCRTKWSDFARNHVSLAMLSHFWPPFPAFRLHKFGAAQEAARFARRMCSLSVRCWHGPHSSWESKQFIVFVCRRRNARTLHLAEWIVALYVWSSSGHKLLTLNV